MFILVKEGIAQYPYSLTQLRADNPGTSFPMEMPNERLAEWGVHPVTQTDPPEYDPQTHVIFQDGAMYNEANQRWETVWVVKPIPIPDIVSMRQGRLAMLATPYGQGSLLDAVDLGIMSISNEIERRVAQIEWEYATEIQRSSPLVQQLSVQLNLTEEQLDDLFLRASKL